MDLGPVSITKIKRNEPPDGCGSQTPIGLTGNVPTGATFLTSTIMVLFFSSAGGVTQTTRIFGFLIHTSLALLCSSQSRGGDLHGQRQTRE